MSKIHSAVPVDRRMAKAMFCEEPEDEEDEDEKENNEEEDEGYSE